MKSVLLVLVLLLLTACGGSQQVQQQSQDDDMVNVYQPGWYQQGASEDEQYFLVCGMGESKDRQTSYNEAKSNATAELAQQLEQKVETMMTNMRRSYGSDEDEQILKSTSQIFRSVTSKVIKGVQVSQNEQKFSKSKNKYVTFLQIRMPKKPIAEQFKQSLKNETALYSEFKEKQMLEDLDKQIEKFEEKQEKQN